MNALKEERVRLNMTQEHVAILCNVSRKTVVNWESDNPIPSDKLGVLKQHGFDIFFIIDGIRSSPVGQVTGEIKISELEDTLEMIYKQVGDALVLVKRMRGGR